jgi:hypothetical protein
VNVKRKEVEIAEAISEAQLRRHTGVLRKSKNLRQNILDGADFVRDVLDTYAERSKFGYPESTSKGGRLCAKHFWLALWSS